MDRREGRCTNKDYCSLGVTRALLYVEPGEPFLCPECRFPLRRPRTLRTLAYAMLAVGTALGAATIALALLTRVPEVPPAPARVGAVAQPPAPAPVPVPRPKPMPPPMPTPLAPVAEAMRPVVHPVQPPPVPTLMRVSGVPPLAESVMPVLSQGFLHAAGDADVETIGHGNWIEVRGKRRTGEEAITISLTETADAFANLAGGNAELAMSLVPPDARTKATMHEYRSVPLPQTTRGRAVLYALLPTDPVAQSFLDFATSPRGHAVLAAAGLLPVPAAPPAAAPQAGKTPAVASAPMPTVVPPPVPTGIAGPVAQEAPMVTALPPSDTQLGQTASAAPSGPRVIHMSQNANVSYSIGPLHDVTLPTEQPRMIFLPPGTSQHVPGQMKVDCLIQANGVPKDCKQVNIAGRAEVAQAILSWLGSGAIRYSPAVKDGKKVDERRVLTVNFRQPAAGQ